MKATVYGTDDALEVLTQLIAQRAAQAAGYEQALATGRLDERTAMNMVDGLNEVRTAIRALEQAAWLVKGTERI